MREGVGQQDDGRRISAPRGYGWRVVPIASTWRAIASRRAPRCALVCALSRQHGTFHVRTAVLVLGGEPVVGSAQDSKIAGGGSAALASRVPMIDLDPRLGAAARAVRTHPGASE